MLAPILVALINLRIWLQNSWRRLMRRHIAYVRLELSGALPEFAPPQPWWRRRFLRTTTPLSLMALRRRLQRIAGDPQTKGVVLIVHDFAPGWATAESLRDEIRAFRATGRRVIAYVQNADTRAYFALCNADELLMPPPAYFNVLGVRIEALFLADALRLAGIEAEVTAVSPYKSGGDQFARSEMSPENREQLERLIDRRYVALVAAIAEGRGLAPERVCALIDAAPLASAAAVEAGLIDAACYEDELETRLAETIQPEQKRPKQLIRPWSTAARTLQQPYRHRQRRLVALLSVEGAISSGSSRNLPLPIPVIGGAQAGSESIARAIRRLEGNRRVAALVLHIDSPGGDAFASDLIWRELLRLRRTMPVVVSMGNVAASGGYYIAVCASAIVAQPATLTGSIGVFSLRPDASRLLETARINAVALSRGASAGLLSPLNSPSETERAITRRTVFEVYETFKARVREGRSLSEQQLEPIAGGRIWTGAEAQPLGLVDALGGLPTAIARARALAKLPADPAAPLLLAQAGPVEELPPQPFPIGDPVALATLLGDALRPRILATLPWLLRDLI